MLSRTRTWMKFEQLLYFRSQLATIHFPISEDWQVLQNNVLAWLMWLTALFWRVINFALEAAHSCPCHSPTLQCHRQLTAHMVLTSHIASYNCQGLLIIIIIINAVCAYAGVSFSNSIITTKIAPWSKAPSMTCQVWQWLLGPNCQSVKTNFHSASICSDAIWPFVFWDSHWTGFPEEAGGLISGSRCRV